MIKGVSNIMKNKFKVSLCSILAMSSLLGISSFANTISSKDIETYGTAYKPYNTTVGRINGNGYTGTDTKSVTGKQGNIRSTSVGGDYKVDVRMYKNDNSQGAWVYNITDNDNRQVPSRSDHMSGNSVKLRFSNKLSTTKEVQVTGSWRADDSQ